jgi:hypothetical protein
MNMAALPNLITGSRLVLGLVMFICLAGPVGAIPLLFDAAEMSTSSWLGRSPWWLSRSRR